MAAAAGMAPGPGYRGRATAGASAWTRATVAPTPGAATLVFLALLVNNLLGGFLGALARRRIGARARAGGGAAAAVALTSALAARGSDLLGLGLILRR
jgi:hypothetical protein